MAEKPYDAFPNAPGLSEELGLTQTDDPAPKRFKNEGGKRYEWYSICSAHREPMADCERCRVGSWIEVFE